MTLSQSSAEFQAQNNGSLPDSQTITADFNGDELVVGYPPGATVASWLDAVNLSGTARPANIQLSVNTTNLTSGTYTTKLRFLTSNLAQSEGNYIDLPVKYTVNTSVAISATQLNFAADTGSLSPAAAQTHNISSDNPWVDMVDVILLVTPPAISISHSNLTFNAVSGTPIAPENVSITINTGESTTWVATTIADWLTLNGANGSTTGTTADSLTVGIDTASSSLVSGNYVATIEVLAVVGNQTLTGTIKVSVNLTDD